MAWNVMHDIERRFDDMRRELMGGPEHALLPAWGAMAPSVRSPALDLADEGNEFIVTADLPGVRKKDIKLDVQPDGIHIRAQSETSKEQKGRTWMKRERSAVAYDRYLGLPDEVSPSQCTASFEDGVLTVHIPKVETGKRSAHRIDVT